MSLYGGASYGRNENSFGSEPLDYEQRRTLDKRVRANVFRTSTVVCCGVCLYVLLADLYSRLITSHEYIYRLYSGETPFSLYSDIIYSFVCVGVPFLLVLAVLNKLERKSVTVNFGKPHNVRNAIRLITASLGICFLGNIIGTVIINWFAGFGLEFYSYRDAVAGVGNADSVSEFILMVIRTAVVPALIEEFAFRGVVLGSLRKYGDGFAVAVSSLLFGLLHGNFTQVPFAAVAGVALGMVYVITGSLWMSVIAHFLNNFISVCYSVLMANAGDIKIVFSAVVTRGLIFLGIIALVRFLLKNEGGLRLRRGRYSSTPNKALAFFLAPTFILGAGALISNMLRDIVR